MTVTPLRDTDAGRAPEPPANIEAEQALLGAILFDNAAHSRVAEFLLAEHFANAVHGRIYAAISKLIERGVVAKPISLKNLFDQDGALADIGGGQYLFRLADSAVGIIPAEHYGRTIHDLYLRRELITIGQDIVGDAFRHDLDMPACALLASAAQRLRQIESGAGASLRLTVASDLAGAPVPDRAWIVPGWIPANQVTLLSGDGGVGKSLLAMQLQIATAAGLPWLGLQGRPCRSLGVYAEDDENELHRRLAALADLACVDVAALGNMAWRCAVADQAELVEPDDSGAVRPTPYFRQIERRAIEFGARLLILDAATNLYGGDEIKRR